MRSRCALYIASLALESVPVFSGIDDESTMVFIRDLEVAFVMNNISVDKYKEFYFRRKLKGIALLWYESLRDSDDYQSWDLLKERFIQQFYNSEQRLKYISKLLKSSSQTANN